MSKTIINIKTLKITLALGTPTAPGNLGDLLQSAIAGGIPGVSIKRVDPEDFLREMAVAAGVQSPAEQGEQAQPEQADATSHEPAPAGSDILALDVQVLSVLADTSKYKSRTAPGIAKALGVEDLVNDVSEALSTLVEQGRVTVRFSSRKNEYLYTAVPQAAEGAQAAPATARTLRNRILAVLNDRSKYRSRSLAGITTAVAADGDGDVDEDAVENELENLVNEDFVSERVSQLGGVLYSLS